MTSLSLIIDGFNFLKMSVIFLLAYKLFSIDIGLRSSAVASVHIHLDFFFFEDNLFLSQYSLDFALNSLSLCEHFVELTKLHLTSVLSLEQFVKSCEIGSLKNLAV